MYTCMHMHAYASMHAGYLTDACMYSLIVRRQSKSNFR